MHNKRAYTEIEAAAYIAMSRSFLRKARMNGNLDGHIPAPPFLKMGRCVRYLKEDLDSWLEQFPKLKHLAALNDANKGAKP